MPLRCSGWPFTLRIDNAMMCYLIQKLFLLLFRILLLSYYYSTYLNKVYC